MKALVFKIVDHYPDNPFEAYFDGSNFNIMDGSGLVWNIAGSEENIQDIQQESGSGQIDSETLLKSLAVALHPEAAKEFVNK